MSHDIVPCPAPCPSCGQRPEVSRALGYVVACYGCLWSGDVPAATGQSWGAAVERWNEALAEVTP